ncbi:MAG: S8 family serine peptidase [Candidatus Poseidonia sp.]|nr:S8 family serine peptidase [Poseidonia sp.]
MRTAWWLVLLFVLPLASGLQTPAYMPKPDIGGEEKLLRLDQAVWTSQAWEEMEQHGVVPLRVVSPETLLVWHPTQSVLPSYVEVIPFDDAVWKGGLDDRGWSDIRLVFEPNLPLLVKEEVIASLSFLDAELIESVALVESVLPTSVHLSVGSRSVVERLLGLDGVLWIEPVLTTKARNAQASALLQDGVFSSHPLWTFGLDGSGIVLGVADSGIDADHACFRNATQDTSLHAEEGAPYPAVGIFGESHRKIIFLNDTIDGNDTPGQSDYRHGTHVVASLGCRDVQSQRTGAEPANGSTLAHGARLVVQDIVNESGWSPPNVDELLYEASVHGAVIHSNSWGDDTTAYTERTGHFDSYARAMPWSLAFIAPGNGGQGILEPANGRNVVAVSASTKDSSPERWGSTAYGPTEEGTDGVFLLAPGKNIQSANGDGFWDTNNDGLRLSSGTSMATPLAAGSAGIIQQLYEDGWIHGPWEPTTHVNLSDIQPEWAVPDVRSVALGSGFTPSGALLRATLALSTTPLDNEFRSGGDVSNALHNPYDGWGVLNLSTLVDTTSLTDGQSPGAHLWAHDSYRLHNTTVNDWFNEYAENDRGLSAFEQNPWFGQGASGPFLQTGDAFTHRFTPLDNESVRVRLAYPAKAQPALVDDLQLRVRLDDGSVMVADRIQGDGAPTSFYGSVVDLGNTSLFPQSNETTFGIDIPASLINGSRFIEVEVAARYVVPGGTPGSVGLDGDAVGFALVVSGVERDSDDHMDGDGDGVNNIDDACPMENASLADLNDDGCLDDDDGDGVHNLDDFCPEEDARGFDANVDGCIDDTDGDGVADPDDACLTDDLAWPVDGSGCYPIDQAPLLVVVEAPQDNSTITDNLSVAWRVVDDDGDGYVSNFTVRFTNQTNLSVFACSGIALQPGVLHRCTWSIPNDLPPYYLQSTTYEIAVTIETTNGSPAAVQPPITTVARENLSFTWNNPMHDDEPAPVSDDASVTIQPMVLIGIIGMLLGFAVARGFRVLNASSSGQEGSYPPFSDEKLAQGIGSSTEQE